MKKVRSFFKENWQIIIAAGLSAVTLYGFERLIYTYNHTTITGVSTINTGNSMGLALHKKGGGGSGLILQPESCKTLGEELIEMANKFAKEST